MKSAAAKFEEHLKRALCQFGQGCRFAVAYSGGPDSHALLVGLSRVRAELECEVRAVNVNHGLHQDAALWSERCRRHGERLGVAIEVIPVVVAAAEGKSLEESARSARYEALCECLGKDEILLTGHTADDQSETVLLQLFRGAGPSGLAGMPFERRLDGIGLVRPMLAWSKSQLLACLVDYGEGFISDPSNVDARFDRSYLRTVIMPELRARWPGIDKTLGRAANMQAEYAAFLNDVADQDLLALQSPDGAALSCDAVRVLHETSARRARNAVREWVRRQGLRAPSERRLRSILVDVVAARGDACPIVDLGPVQVRRYRGSVQLVPRPVAIPEPNWQQWWQPPEVLILEQGTLSARPVAGEGIDAARVQALPLRVCGRRGGERCRLPGRKGSRSLKKLYQERGIAPWLRESMPLIYDGEHLVAVGDLWVCEPYAATGSTVGLRIQWRPSRDAAH